MGSSSSGPFQSTPWTRSTSPNLTRFWTSDAGRCSTRATVWPIERTMSTKTKTSTSGLARRGRPEIRRVAMDDLYGRRWTGPQQGQCGDSGPRRRYVVRDGPERSSLRRHGLDPGGYLQNRANLRSVGREHLGRQSQPERSPSIRSLGELQPSPRLGPAGRSGLRIQASWGGGACGLSARCGWEPHTA